MTPENPNPRQRARANIKGVPVTLAGGDEWLLPETLTGRAFDPIRDKLFDDATLCGEVDRWLVRLAATGLITINYELTREEAQGLIAGAEDAELTRAVMDALIGPEEPKRMFSSWVRSTLYANGLDPRKIPQEDLNFVLFQLVNTGCAVPLDEYAHSSIAVQEKRNLLAG